MSDISFEDAVTDLVRRFIVATPQEKENFQRQFGPLTATSLRKPLRPAHDAEDDERFDNMPV